MGSVMKQSIAVGVANIRGSLDKLAHARAANQSLQWRATFDARSILAFIFTFEYWQNPLRKPPRGSCQSSCAATKGTLVDWRVRCRCCASAWTKSSWSGGGRGRGLARAWCARAWQACLRLAGQPFRICTNTGTSTNTSHTSVCLASLAGEKTKSGRATRYQ